MTLSLYEPAVWFWPSNGAFMSNIVSVSRAPRGPNAPDLRWPSAGGREDPGLWWSPEPVHHPPSAEAPGRPAAGWVSTSV